MAAVKIFSLNYIYVAFMLPVAALPLIEYCLQHFKEAVTSFLNFTYV